MRLYLMRHGIAQDRGRPDGPPDAERALTRRGKARVRAAADGLKALHIAPQQVWSSPLLRAVQTAQLVALRLEIPKSALHQTKALAPGADPAALLQELQAAKAEAVLCCGHAPHVDRVLALCLGASAAVSALKKAGLADIAILGFSPLSARLEGLFPPGALRRLG